MYDDHDHRSRDERDYYRRRSPTSRDHQYRSRHGKKKTLLGRLEEPLQGVPEERIPTVDEGICRLIDETFRPRTDTATPLEILMLGTVMVMPPMTILVESRPIVATTDTTTSTTTVEDDTLEARVAPGRAAPLLPILPMKAHTTALHTVPDQADLIIP
ncbi:hypothetical protein F4810DRAFT_62828 [Camillea tinctor]|nr:hypothetical protein F4810DRAFT_62828 [Camillea tinctor]